MIKNIASFLTTTLFVQIFFFYTLTSSQKYDCDPLEKCKKSSGGSKVPNPEDCFSYYVCVKDQQGNLFPSDKPFKCDEGYYFDQTNSYCRSGTTCENQCLKLCESGCTDNIFEKIPDYNDCSSFYLCLPGGTKSHHNCPDRKPYFDGSECRKESYVCCGCCDECTPFCRDQYTEVADPYDCRSYFLCLKTGYPTNDTRYTCEEGKIFDASTGRCQHEDGWSRCKSKCS